MIESTPNLLTPPIPSTITPRSPKPPKPSPPSTPIIQVLKPSPLLTLLTLYDQPQHAHISTILSSHLSMHDINNLRLACKFVNHTIRTTYWNFNRSLSSYVLNPVRFRNKLGVCDALISGRFAVQFFGRGSWVSSEDAVQPVKRNFTDVTKLDIFIESGIKADTFVRHLEKKEGYEAFTEKKPCIPEAWLMGEDIEVMEIYAKAWPGPLPSTARRITKIHVFKTRTLPIIAILTGPCHTAAVNFISSTRAYSLFPLSTFIHFKTYDLKVRDNIYCDLMTGDYAKQGWELYDILHQEDKRFNHPIRRHRFVGDRYTWSIPLELQGITAPSTPESVLEMSEFKIGKDEYEQEDEECYTIRTGPLEIFGLKYRYTSPYPLGCSFYKFIKAEMEVAEEEKWIWKMEVAKNSRAKASVSQCSGDFYDDQLKRWFVEWLRSNWKECQREPMLLEEVGGTRRMWRF